MNIWDQLTHQAYDLLTHPRRTELTPAVTLVQSLHKQPPTHPGAICSHFPTATTVLPTLAGYARNGDRHALLMAAVLMRHALRRIAEYADPDGYHTSDQDVRANFTLTVFFTLIRTAAEPQTLTARYCYATTLKRVLTARPRTGTLNAPIRVDPTDPVLDHTDHGTDYSRAAQLLAKARENAVITALEHETLAALYLRADVYNLADTATALGAKTGAVERRAQRAINKLARYQREAVAA
ncbi:hypothetical protein [Mycobacterium servetii]|uniref:Uncharacterized protein n=1 Tax=Mycobacterium servetii TaxID=3237418 RepID=A0ABV4C9H6_9MYCO